MSYTTSRDTIQRSIAEALGRSVSTMCRELQRNTGSIPYEEHSANTQARERRHRPRRQCKLSPDSELWQVVTEMLAKGWSPQQIAAKLKANWPGKAEWQVSHETIYLAIYAYPRGELKRQLIGWQGKRHRPEEVEGRQVPGHWEMRPDHGGQ